MRGTFTFAFLLASILVVVAGAAHLAGASIITAVVACVCGAIFTMLAAIIVNTRNAAIYGRTVWDDGQHSDFVEPELGGRRVRVRRGRGRGAHATSFSGLEASVRDE